MKKKGILPTIGSVILIVSLLLGIVLQPAFSESAENTDKPLPDGSVTDEILAWINGEPVYQSFVDAYVEYYIDYYGLTEDTDIAYVKDNCLGIGFEDALIHQIATANEIILTEEEKQHSADDTVAAWNENVLYCAQAYYGLTDDATEEERTEALAAGEAYLIDYLGIDLPQAIEEDQNSLLYMKVVDSYTADITITDEEASAAYDEQVEADKAMFEGNAMMYELYSMYYGYSSTYMPAGYRAVKTILLAVDETVLDQYLSLSSAFEAQTEDSEAAVTAEQVEEARLAVIALVQPAIDDIYAQLEAGVSFDELIAKYGVDPLMQTESGISSGYFISQDGMEDPSFIAAAFSIESIGGVSEPAVTPSGVVICYYLEDIPEGKIELTADAFEALKMELLETKKTDAFGAMIETMIEESDIVYTELGRTYLLPEEDEAEEAAGNTVTDPQDDLNETEADAVDGADMPETDTEAAPEGEHPAEVSSDEAAANPVPSDDAGVEAGIEQTDSAAAVLSDKDIMFSVDGQPVQRGVVDYYVNYYVSYYAQQGYDMTSQENLAYLQAQCMNLAVQMKLCAIKAEKAGLGLTEEEQNTFAATISSSWDTYVDNYAALLFGLTENSSEEEKASAIRQAEEYMVSQIGCTKETLITVQLENELYSRLMKAETGDITVTDEAVQAQFDVKAAYDKANFEGNIMLYEYYTNQMGYTSYYIPEGYRGIIQILLPVDKDILDNYTTLSSAYAGQAKDAENPVTAEQVEEARQAVIASVEPTLTEIKDKFAAGTPFTDLIDQYNTDPGMKQESYRNEGYAVHADSIVWDSAFTSAAMSIPEIGQMSEPSIGSYGIYICYYLRDIPSGTIELTDAICSSIRAELLSEAQSEAFSALLSQWSSESIIEYTDNGMKYLNALTVGEVTTETAGESVTDTEETPVPADSAPEAEGN